MQNDRACAFRLLCFDNLNKEEANHVNEITNNHNDIFQLPDEPLSHTGVTVHKITTTDNRPINTK